MVVYIHIGNQILSEDNSFSFYNTVTDRFFEFNGYQVFDSKEDFIDSYKDSEVSKNYELERFINKIPNDLV